MSFNSTGVNTFSTGVNPFSTGQYAPSIVDLASSLMVVAISSLPLKTSSALTRNVFQASLNVFQTSLKVVACAGTCLHEFVDVTNSRGTKDPIESINTSHQRVSQHNLPFANCIEFLADQAAQVYLDNSEKIKEKICEAIADSPTDQMSHEEVIENTLNPILLMKMTFTQSVAYVTDWFLSLSKELIAKTIKANIMHIAANLADKAYADDYVFKDNQLNPFGRLLSVISRCLAQYDDRLNGIALLPLDEQALAYSLLFQEMSSALLEKFFPNGASDLQLFHHTIPLMSVIKELVWNLLNQKLPFILERFYLETRPIAEEYSDWKEQFDAKGGGLKADQLVTGPSYFIENFIRSNQARAVESLIPKVQTFLREQRCCAEDVEEFSHHFIKYAKELLLTNEPSLHKMGTFFERYLMEHMLFNLSQSVPEGGDHSIPVYLFKEWIEGDFFKVLRGSLVGETMTPEVKTQGVKQLLAPFGLTQENNFPLPPFIKSQVWPSIEDALRSQVPQALFTLIPTWMVLRDKTENQNAANQLLGDSSVTQTIARCSGTLMDKLFESIQLHSSAKQVNELFLSPVLTVDEQNAIDQQLQIFLKKNPSIDLLKNFGSQCVESLVLQIFKDFYKTYQKASAALNDSHQLAGVHLLFGGDEEDQENEESVEGEISTFFPWIFLELSKACESLKMDDLSSNDVKNLQTALHMNQVIRETIDEEERKKYQEQFETLWPMIQPKFDRLTARLLEIVGVKRGADLPSPKELQSILWKILNEKLPRILFEQAGDLMLPIFKKKELQDEIKMWKEGALINQGCQTLAQDVVSHIPEWLVGKLDHLSEKIAGHFPDVQLSDAMGNNLAATMTAIVNKEDPTYEVIWQWLESYLEGLFLKIASRLGKMSEHDIQKLATLVQQTRENLVALENDEDEDVEDKKDLLDNSAAVKDILAGFTDQLFALLGIESSKDLFGIPHSLQGLILKEIKSKTAGCLLGIYHSEHEIRHHTVKANPFEEHLPTSKVALATLALVRLGLDGVTDKLTEQVEGKAVTISQIYGPLDGFLKKLAGQNYKIAGLFQGVIAKDIPTPFLIQLFNLFDADSTQVHKNSLAEWMTPFLTNQVIQHLTPLLEKEQEGQAAFDQSIVMALLPVLTHHFHCLNQASQVDGGLNDESFIGAAGSDLHPALHLIKGDEKEVLLKKKNEFYQGQVDLIFQLILPNGKKDVEKFFPDFPISDQEFMDVLNVSKGLVVDQLPQVLPMIFDKEILLPLFISLFENGIEGLSQPIEIKFPEAKVKLLTQAEAAEQKKMNEQIGKLVMEVATFLDLPIGVLKKLPGLVRKITGLNGIEKNVYESIGEKVREKFNGQLFADQIPKILDQLAEKKYKKTTPSERVKAVKQSELNLLKLEKTLAQKSLTYLFSYLGTRLENATDIFTHPVLKFFRRAILSICSFVMITLIGSILRFLKVDRFVINSLYYIIHHRSQRMQKIFTQPQLHENLVYQGVEAFEGVLLGNTDE